MSQIIYGRSQLEIDEDDVTSTHTLAAKWLADWIYDGASSGYWLTGKRREAVKVVMAKCESVMLGDAEYGKSFRISANFALHHCIGL